MVNVSKLLGKGKKTPEGIVSKVKGTSRPTDGIVNKIMGGSKASIDKIARKAR